MPSTRTARFPARSRCAAALLGAALLAVPGCCTESDKAIQDYGAPDIVYELRGGTGKWFWYTDPPTATPTPPTEVGFLWLELDHQTVYDNDGCQTYDGPIKSEDWRRFEQARSREVGAAP